jgi:5-methylcytosine-specific restriction endonuclease McrA
MLNDPTLVLNRSWIAVSTTTVREAISMVYRGVARVIQPDNFQTHDFDSWADLAAVQDGPVIHTVRLRIRVPEVILLLRHDRMPSRAVPFSRRNLYRRDGFRCQYCGTRQPTQELSIDHVLPRSRGGRTTWDNCVLACIPCNVRKGNRTLQESGMSLRRVPARPAWSPCLTVTVARRRASWEKFVSEQYWDVALEE